MILTARTRQDILNILQEDWGTYVGRFRGLPPEAQSTFLAEQGYDRFADLLSHIIAWWEIGHQAIEGYLTDPQFQPNEYDVDAFNAEAVAKAGGLDDVKVIESFEKMRGFLFEYVKALPGNVFENEKVVNQFNLELVGHLSEHDIPERG
jgi:hypothetical protein